jgi:hypothetical protein
MRVSKKLLLERIKAHIVTLMKSKSAAIEAEVRYNRAVAEQTRNKILWAKTLIRNLSLDANLTVSEYNYGPTPEIRLQIASPGIEIPRHIINNSVEPVSPGADEIARQIAKARQNLALVEIAEGETFTLRQRELVDFSHYLV